MNTPTEDGVTWSSVVDACPTGVLLMEFDGRLVQANQAACDLLGLDGNRLLAAYSSDYLRLGAHLRQLAAAQPADGGGRQLSQRVVRPDGASVWVEFRLVALPSQHPAAPGRLAAVYLTDRTKVHLQERTVRARIAGVDLALSEASVAVVVTDGAARVVRWSPGAEQLFGHQEDTAVGRSLAALVDVRPSIVEGLLAQAATGAVVRGARVSIGLPVAGSELRVSVALTATDELVSHPAPAGTRPIVSGTTDAARYAWVLLPASHVAAGPTLRSNERRLRKILQNINDTVTIIDETGQAIASSGHWSDEPILGYPQEAWTAGMNMFDLVDEADQEWLGAAFEELMARPGERFSGSLRMRTADGGLIDAEGWAVNLLDDPDVAGILITTRNVSERKRNEAFMTSQADVLRQIASAAPLEMTMRRLVELVNSHVPDTSSALLQHAGGSEGRTFSSLPFPQGSAEPLVNALGMPAPGAPSILEDLDALQDFPELVATLREGGHRGVVLLPLVGATTAPSTGQHANLGALVCLLGPGATLGSRELDVLRSAADLAAIAIEREQSERHLAHQALHDELTGLANRHLLVDRLEQALNRAKRRGRSLALMFLDLDRFKTINDTLGHDVGDQLLRQFAERLRLLVRPEDTVARFGGDEFVVLVEHVIDEQDAAQIADRLEGAMAEPFQLNGHPLAVTASVGIVIGKGDDEPASLLRNADTAMYRAKELGRNRTEIYDTRLEAHLADRTQLGLDLRTALAEGHLRLVYQPIIDLRSGEMRMIEALLRWDHPDHGRLLPLDFLAVAEDSGQALELGTWVIERALTDLAAFARDPAWVAAPGWPRPPRLSVNLSARQLAHPDLVARVEQALARHRFLPQNLAIDVSERVLAAAGEMVLRNLERLHRLGVGIALDDVGAAPSTALLSVLDRVPADILKVDPSVIASMGLGEREQGSHRESLQRSMAAGLLGLGRGLGLTVVAEGVDNARRLQQLRQLGYDLAQGNVLGPPVEADQMVRLLPG